MRASLAETQVEQYRRDGYLAPLHGITPMEAARWRAVVEDFGRRNDVYEAHVLRNKADLKMPSLMPVVRDDRILDVVEGVLGPDILCWGSSLLIKEASAPEFVAWHQDSYS
jgi:non-heme Fe2+,alpha-ketoglutarate-dependent halogenase